MTTQTSYQDNSVRTWNAQQYFKDEVQFSEDVYFKKAPWYDVKGYGATGTGTDDQASYLTAAVAAMPTTGGTLFIPDGTYYLNTDFTIAKKGVHVVTGNVNIVLNGGHIVVSQGYHGFSWRGPGSWSPYSVGITGCFIQGATNDHAFEIGSSAGDTEYVEISDVTIYGGSGSGAKGHVVLNRVVYCSLNRIRINMSAGETGIYMDGTGGYTGYVNVNQPSITGGAYGIRMTAGPCNANQVNGGSVNSATTAGISIEHTTTHSNGNLIAGTDFESNAIALNIDADNSMIVGTRFETNTSDLTFGANSSNNFALVASNAVTLTNSGTRNVIWIPGHGIPMPGFTTTARQALTGVALGTIVYDTTLNMFMGYGYNGWQYMSTGCEAS